MLLLHTNCPVKHTQFRSKFFIPVLPSAHLSLFEKVTSKKDRLGISTSQMNCKNQSNRIRTIDLPLPKHLFIVEHKVLRLLLIFYWFCLIYTYNWSDIWSLFDQYLTTFLRSKAIALFPKRIDRFLRFGFEV